MTEEQLEAKGKYAGEKKPSMKRRADHHDYTERRMYMITLEVEGRKPVFGHLVGNACRGDRGSEGSHHEEHGGNPTAVRQSYGLLVCMMAAAKPQPTIKEITIKTNDRDRGTT